MAKQKLVTLVDDLDGTEAQVSVEFGVEGRLWEIDLNETHQRELFGALSKFITAASPLGPYQLGDGRNALPQHGTRTVSGGRTPVEGRSSEVRAWAAAAGIPVQPRGRVPKEVIAQFEREHQG